MKGVIKNPNAPSRSKSGKKRCIKGKPCGASCINQRIICRIDLGNSAGENLGKLREARVQSVVAAHPSLAEDYTETNIRRAIDEIASLDKDAERRVSVIKKLLSKTKTVFIDWKDEATNREVFVQATSKIHENPVKVFNDKASSKTWGGVAFISGSTMVKASPGFKPSVKEIKALVIKQLNDLSNNKNLPYAVGKGTKGLGNNPLVTLIHELGHHGHFSSKTMPIGNNLKMVSIYAETNYKEHYAELFTAYVFAGPKLKALYPMEYEAVENVLSKGGLL